MNNFQWSVVPLCNAQLLDVNKSDILNDGLYRKCNTYKGGGGYDRFPTTYINNIGFEENLNHQFVVQLYDCPLNCSYCYVTRKGIFGEPVKVSTEKLLADFRDSDCKVLHLMGGAPALYLNHWQEILDNLNNEIFHSDFLLIENEYDLDVLKELAKYPKQLHAVSIKGSNEEEYFVNTKTKISMDLLWKNLDKLVESELPIYLTFTGMNDDSVNDFGNECVKRYGAEILIGAFSIDLIKYKALDYENNRNG